MIIRQAQLPDVDSISNLHNQALTPQICDLTALGSRVVKEFYFKVLMDNLGYIALAEDNNIAGFCLISRNVEKLFKRSLSKNVFHILRTFCLSNKKSFLRVISNKLLYGTLITDGGPQLVYIAVDSSFAGRGIGQKLLEHVEKKFFYWGINEYTLDVEEDNISAINFYKKNHFIKEREYYLGNRKKILLRKMLRNL